MLHAFEPWHLLIITGVATVLFGAKRLPDSARSIGQSLRILRAETAASPVAADQIDQGPLTTAQDATAQKSAPTADHAAAP